MELVVEDPGFRERLDAPGYRVAQRTNSSLFYWNTRLARRDAGARYHGVTHEYLDVPGGTKNCGVWYKRPRQRIEPGGQVRARHQAALAGDRAGPPQYALLVLPGAVLSRCRTDRESGRGLCETGRNGRLGGGGMVRAPGTGALPAQLGDEGGFLREAVAAYNQRPERAEPLYDLARYYRDRGMNAACVLFCEPGLSLPRPDHDVLFLEEFVYTTGLREEFSIAANYAADPERKDRGFAACNWLALSREVPSPQREIAWSNLFFYYGAATAMMPSFTARPVRVHGPERIPTVEPVGGAAGRPRSWWSTDPSTSRWPRTTVSSIRLRTDRRSMRGISCCSWRTTWRSDRRSRSAAGRPAGTGRPDGYSGSRTCGCSPGVANCGAAPPFAQRRRRLGASRGLHVSIAARRARTGFTDWRVLDPDGPRVHEKNWMPRVAGDTLQFICLCDPTRVVDEHGNTVAETVPAIAATHFRGGSQAIAFDGGWLALVHEVQERREAMVLSASVHLARHGRHVCAASAARSVSIARRGSNSPPVLPGTRTASA